MARGSDVLKELEDIGVVGGSQPEDRVSNQTPVGPKQILQMDAVNGLVEKLVSLEHALQETLHWCQNVKLVLCAEDEVSSLPDVEVVLPPVERVHKPTEAATKQEEANGDVQGSEGPGNHHPAWVREN